MGKIFLIVLGVLAAALYFEGSRAVIFEKARPFLDPYFVMATRSEMDKINTDLQLWERENFGRLPDGRAFGGWLEGNYAGGAGMDAWGSRYEYTLGRDSFFLRSLGPDLVRGTEDDIIDARARTGTGVAR